MLVVPLAQALLMRAQPVGTSAGKVETLRSVRLPRPMAAEVAEQALVLLRLVLAVVAEASVRRALLHPYQVQMAQEAEVVALPPQASML